jgi:EmrB/QacA subfamily drug resistance transporter
MGTRVKVIVMAGTMLGLFTSAMDQTVVGTSMPRIIANLGGFGLFSWVGTGFMLASTATIPVVGKLSDIYGRKPFYMAGIVLLLLGSALCGQCQSVEQLIAFRVIQGLGAGMIMGIAFAILGDVFAPAERAKWAGLMSGVFASASVVGPLIGGTLTDNVSWRWIFYVNLPLGAIALVVLFLGMPNVRPSGRSRIDYRGIALLWATVVPMLLAFSWAGSRYEWVSPQVIGLLCWAAAGLVMFTYAELRADEPLLPMSLFKNRIFTVSALVTIISGVAMMGSFFYIPLFVQGVIGSSATNSGIVLMPMMISMAIASAVAGQIMSRIGHYRWLGMLGLSTMVVGVFLLSQLDVSSTRRDVAIPMVVFGVGLGSSMPLYMLAVQNAVPHRFMGISTSTMQFLRSVGGTMGVAVFFSLIQSHYHQGLVTTVPESVRAQPELTKVISDPTFVLNPQAFQHVQQAFSQFGDQGGALLTQTLQGIRESLAGGITDAFFVAIFVMITAVVIGLFMKEIPLRKVHYQADLEAEVMATGATPALRPIAGGANGAPPSA